MPMHAEHPGQENALAAAGTASATASTVEVRARASELRRGRPSAVWPAALCTLVLCACGGGTGESANPLPNQATIVLGGRTATPAKPEAAPVLVAAPQPLVVADGEPAMFIVVAQGAGLQYRWVVNGATVFGVSGPVLQLHAAMRADDGAHVSVVVSNDAGQLATPPVRLSVEPAGWRAPWS
jgi:hypothetical protein